MLQSLTASRGGGGGRDQVNFVVTPSKSSNFPHPPPFNQVINNDLDQSLLLFQHHALRMADPISNVLSSFQLMYLILLQFSWLDPDSHRSPIDLAIWE